jgi:predicted regulator of Ras-like GTPase activity (Roadblock/LC7/MglB family)
VTTPFLPPHHRAPSESARDLHWLLDRLVQEVPGLISVAVVSADGLPLLSSEAPGAAPLSPLGGSRMGQRGGPRGSAADLATIVSGLGSLTGGAASLMSGGPVRQTLVAMDTGNLLVMSISDGSLLGVYTEPDADMGLVTYHMALFVGRAGHLLTPRLRAELRAGAQPDAYSRLGG